MEVVVKPCDNKRYNAPHLYSVGHRHRICHYSYTYTRNECCPSSHRIENYHISILGLRKHFLYVCRGKQLPRHHKIKKNFRNEQHLRDIVHKNIRNYSPRTIKSVCKKSFRKVLFSMPLRKIILSLSKVYFGVVGGNKKNGSDQIKWPSHPFLTIER